MNSPTQEASEAANSYVASVDVDLKLDTNISYYYDSDSMVKSFEAGAQWQLTNLAEKGVEGADKVWICFADQHNSETVYPVDPGHLKPDENGEFEYREAVVFLQALPVLAKINQLQEQVEKDKAEIERLEKVISDKIDAQNKWFCEVFKSSEETFRLFDRADLIGNAEAMDKSQEAAHYNWLDDQNDKLESENAALSSRVRELEEALTKIDFIQINEVPERITNVADKLRYIANQALKERP